MFVVVFFSFVNFVGAVFIWIGLKRKSIKILFCIFFQKSSAYLQNIHWFFLRLPPFQGGFAFAEWGGQLIVFIYIFYKKETKEIFLVYITWN